MSYQLARKSGLQSRALLLFLYCMRHSTFTDASSTNSSTLTEGGCVIANADGSYTCNGCSVDHCILVPLTVHTASLRCNAIGSVDEFIHRQLPYLQKLDISANELTGTLDLAQLAAVAPALRTLNVAENHIKAITSCSSPGALLGLQELDLSHNNIVSISRTALACLPQMKTLNASYNQLLGAIEAQAFVAAGLTLSVLDLSAAGALQVLTNDALAGLAALDELHLNAMPALSCIEPGAFDDIGASLRTLNASGNRALRNLPAEALWALARVEAIDMQDGALEELPEIQSLYLHRLRLSGNPQLACSCRLRWLLDRPSVLRQNAGSLNESCYDDAQQRHIPLAQSNLTSCTLILHSDHTVYGQPGANITLSCLPASLTRTKVTWTAPEGSAMAADPHSQQCTWRILSNGSLHLVHLQPTDRGRYKCRAQSRSGNESEHTTVLVRFDSCALPRVEMAGLIIAGSLAGTVLVAAAVATVSRHIAAAVHASGGMRAAAAGIRLRRLLSRAGAYRTHKLDTLRETCTQQAARLRDAYRARSARLRAKCAAESRRLANNYQRQLQRVTRSMQDTAGATAALAKMVAELQRKHEERLCELREYTSERMRRMRHTYRVQQQYIGKVLESMHLENCHGGGDYFSEEDEELGALKKLGTEDATGHVSADCSADAPCDDAQSVYVTAPSTPGHTGNHVLPTTLLLMPATVHYDEEFNQEESLTAAADGAVHEEKVFSAEHSAGIEQGEMDNDSALRGQSSCRKKQSEA